MKSSPIKLKQNLSPKASAAKSKRDLAAANSPYRKAARASSQRAHRANPNASGDYDHKTSTFKSVNSNRGNNGKGTKIEGKSNYKIKN